MKQRSSTQAGFTVIEPLLVIVLLAIIGFVGYYVYHANAKATDTYDNANNSSSAPVLHTKKDSPSPTSSSLSSSYNDVTANDNQTSTDLNDAHSSLAN